MKNKSIEFKSIFSNEFSEFIKYKRLYGYEYGERMCEKIKSLDNFFEKENLKEKRITIEIIEKWLNKNPKNSVATKSLKYGTITSFSKFLLSKGYKDIFIILENPYHSKNRFIPNIYSKEDINKIFEFLSVDKNTIKGLLIYTCINLLYCCGLRVSELVNLKLEDFNHNTNILTIKNGKNDVTRLIPLTDTLSKLLEEYISNNVYISNDDFIFCGKIGRRYLCSIIRNSFKKTIHKIGTKNISKDKSPRLHDLRHTFAIHTLDNMLNKGYELYQCLPTLSVYLGHKSVYETEYYLRLIEMNFKELTNKITEYTSNIYKRKDNIYNGE